MTSIVPFISPLLHFRNNSPSPYYCTQSSLFSPHTHRHKRITACLHHLLLSSYAAFQIICGRLSLTLFAIPPAPSSFAKHHGFHTFTFTAFVPASPELCISNSMRS
eukprot:gb/GEZJ01006773.1/.p1 GENE.gb/GEZJ01006773.1/~~gb/GEZJ01006773.1/.p1  ORF type:complete len:106 (+),score=6.20 gb/GEZJ01006773.1/:575-892(+)